MSFRLLIARYNEDGEVSVPQHQSSADPLPSRTAAGLDAMRVLGVNCPGVTIAEGKELGRLVRDTPLGVSISHPSGFVFRVEEF